jgi:hypothetical protein
MSRKKKFKIYKDTLPKPPRPPGRLPMPQVFVPDPRLTPECTQMASDQTRRVPCVGHGVVINSPGTSISVPPDRSNQ